MKRVIGLIVVSFLLGVAAEMTIAWSAVLGAAPTAIAAMETDGASLPDAAMVQWWRDNAEVTGATDALMVTERRGELLTVRLIGGSDPGVYTINASGPTIALHHDPAEKPPWIRVVQIEAGWPRRAFSGERWERGIEKVELRPFHLQEIPGPAVAPEDVTLAGAVVLQLTGSTPRDVLLPVRPIWGALLLDSAILALPILALLSMLVAVRWSWRRTRGRCPGCGYELRGDPATGCPECGWKRA